MKMMRVNISKDNWLLTWIVFAGLTVCIDYYFSIPVSVACVLFMIFAFLQRIGCEKCNHSNKTALNTGSYFETLINLSDDTIMLLDVTGHILMINVNGARRLKKTQEELTGYNAFELLSGKTLENRRKKFQYAIEHKKAVRFIDQRDGIDFDQIMEPVFDHSGNVTAIAIYGRDITELKRIEKQLQKARQDSEKANIAKTIFLTHASHELRTPLNVILGYTQILQSSDHLTTDDQKNISLILNNTEFIISLIDDILDLSKIETQQMELTTDAFELKEVLAYVSDIAHIYKQEKSLGFSYQFDDHLPQYVVGDERRLKQILLNLLVNAFKFTQEGKVTFSVSLSEDEAIRFCIADTGVGIQDDIMADIFKPFYRKTSTAEGFGLGLTIAQHLVEMMGGKLQLKSIVGEGTTFWFQLFLETVDIPQQMHRKQKKYDVINGYSGVKKSILIVDDLRDNRTILKRMIAPIGFEIKEASTGQAALDMIKNGYNPDLILLDLIMPIMDGFVFAHQMKNQFPELSTKIIAVSASPLENAEDFDAYISKPIKREKLLQHIGDQLDIQWKMTHNNNQCINPPDKRLHVPDKQVLQRLIDHAQNGQITDIKHEIRRLEDHDLKYQAFIKKIEFYISGLDFNALIDYINCLTQENKKT